jgi:hypothetical protein
VKGGEIMFDLCDFNLATQLLHKLRAVCTEQLKVFILSMLTE